MKLSNKINIILLSVFVLFIGISAFTNYQYGQIQLRERFRQIVKYHMEASNIDSPELVGNMLIGKDEAVKLYLKKIKQRDELEDITILTNDDGMAEINKINCEKDGVINSQCLAQNKDKYILYSALNYGNGEFGYIKKVFNSPSAGFMSASELLKFAMSLMALYLIAFAVLSKSIRGIVINPLKEIGRRLKPLSRGEYNIEFPKQSTEELSDLTSDIRILIQDIKHYQAEVIKLYNLASVGEIVNQIAHDLRSPLQTLLHSIGQIEKVAGDNGEVAVNVESARGACGRLKYMADDLLDFKKARNLERTDILLSPIIKDSIKDVLAQAGQRGVKISASFPAKIVINADGYKLQRVLTNMLLNAVQAIKHESGEIEIVVGCPASVGEFVLTIKDNGSGIKPEHLAKIFDCSFTFGKVGGTGLGLAYAQQVIEAHGGTIKVESEVGKGTKFMITLPESAIVEKGGEEIVNISEVPPVKEKHWILMTNEEDVKKSWHELFQKSSAKIGTEVADVEGFIKQKIDYMSTKGIIMDCKTIESELDLSSFVDIAQLVSSKGVKKIHYCAREPLNEHYTDRFKTAGITHIFNKPLKEEDYKKIFEG